MPDLQIHNKLWMSCGTSSATFGTGKVRLLEAIDRTGSLQEAATLLGISYRKAWADLQKAETCLECKLIEKTRGGRGGGRTELTDQGHRVVSAFNVMNSTLLRNLHGEFDVFLREVRS